MPDLYDSAIMLMKTHVEKLSETGLAIMLMKKQALTCGLPLYHRKYMWLQESCFQFWSLVKKKRKVLILVWTKPLRGMRNPTLGAASAGTLQVPSNLTAIPV